MNIIFRMDRHVEVEDVADPRDVEAACRYIGSHQEPDVARPEPVQRIGTAELWHVAMQRRSLEPMLRQRLHKDIDIALAVAEDEAVLDLLGAQNFPQRRALVVAVDQRHLLIDRFRRGSGRGD